MPTTLYRNGRLHPAGGALLVEDDLLAWVGDDGSAPEADLEVDLDGCLVTPAFVDAHVHATSTGLALDGLDLSGVRSLAAVLDAVATHARTTADSVLLGTGWDETDWPEGRAPTADDLDRASAGAPVYLARADVHSAVVSRALLASCPEAAGENGYTESGHVRLAAHHTLRAAAYASVPPDQRAAAQRRALRHAGSLGIGCVHEMAGPQVSGVNDLVGLFALADTRIGPDVIGYWGDLGDIDTPLQLGVDAGGDLFCDGAFGSHTAAVTEPYDDDTATRGHLYHDADAIAEHIEACTRAGLQAGFHAIGDRTLDAIVDGLDKAAARLGAERVAGARHRVEHAELADAAIVAAFARHRVIASVQPAFDATWGGPDGMYVRRLGPRRAALLNPFAAYAAAGVMLAIGSDAPVTPLDPWGGARAAVRHRTPGAGLSPEAAFAAATAGGWAAVRRTGGTLEVDAPATFAVWDTPEFPDLTADAAAPTCRRTVVRGTTVFCED